MKKAPGFIACSIALTLLFYMLAYYLLPPPPPSVAMVLLFAAVAMVITWGVAALIRKYRSHGAGSESGAGNKTHVVVAFFLLGLLSSSHQAQTQGSTFQELSTLCKFSAGPLAGKTRDFAPQPPMRVGSSCSDGAGSAGVIVSARIEQPWDLGSHEWSHGGKQDKNRGDRHSVAREKSPSERPAPKPAPAPEPGPAPPVPPPPPNLGQGAPPPVPIGSGFPPPPPPPRAGDGMPRAPQDSLPRVTGTAILLPRESEQPGYGLYSYALISHRPQPGELPKYKAYFKALLALPTAESVGQYVPIKRINITYLPLDALAPTWTTMSIDDRVNYAVEHYDFARGQVMLACLSKHTGPGPVIISLLKPLDLSEHPRPVLVQDLTAAEPSLMASYVSYFVQQAAKDDFWQEKALARMSLNLRNGLEVAAEGLGMSKTAVETWVKLFN